MKRSVIIEDESAMDRVIAYFRSKAGHGAIVLVSCTVLTVLTTFLFADTLEGIRGWHLAGIGIGILFSISFEISVFWTAINGYRLASYVFAVFSVVIARATFEQFFDAPQLSFMYAASWIMSISPVLIVLIASHKLADKYRLEEKAKAHLHELGKQNGHLKDAERFYDLT